MSPDNAVEIAGVSKQFRTYRSSGDQILELLSLGLVRRQRLHQALRDVSFTVARGECVGILGTNGSGKSTLLQIVAGTMRPSEGQISVRGRVAALLELGAGFAPDFTGRENALLSARLLGCSEAEAEALLPRIIEFAGIGEFIDRPVRTYSSGMYVRLAFATAASASPDVFIIDEALAVGDRVFQGRCYARLRELKQAGATILFVSHDLASVGSFCDRAVWIEKGHLRSQGAVQTVVADYIAGTRHAPPVPVPEARVTAGDGLVLRPGGRVDLDGLDASDHRPAASLLSVRLEAGDGHVVLGVDGVVRNDVRDPDLSLAVKDIRGLPLYGTGTSSEGRRIGPLRAGDRFHAVFRISMPLRGDLYPLALSLSDGCHTGPHLPIDTIDGRLFMEVPARGRGRHLIDVPCDVEVDVLHSGVGVLMPPRREMHRRSICA